MIKNPIKKTSIADAIGIFERDREGSVFHRWNMLEIVTYNSREIVFNQSVEACLVKITNKFGLDVPNIKVKANRVYFEELIPGSYQIQFGHRGHYQLQAIFIDSEQLELPQNSYHHALSLY